MTNDDLLALSKEFFELITERVKQYGPAAMAGVALGVGAYLATLRDGDGHPDRLFAEQMAAAYNVARSTVAHG